MSPTSFTINVSSTFAPNGDAVQPWAAHTITPGAAHLLPPIQRHRCSLAAGDIAAEREKTRDRQDATKTKIKRDQKQRKRECSGQTPERRSLDGTFFNPGNTTVVLIKDTGAWFLGDFPGCQVLDGGSSYQQTVVADRKGAPSSQDSAILTKVRAI